MTKSRPEIEVNGRRYARPDRPLVVVCIDGSEPAYNEQAVAAGCMPVTDGMLARGADLRARCAVPSFTNPNNLSIVCGAPPAVHGNSDKHKVLGSSPTNHHFLGLTDPLKSHGGLSEETLQLLFSRPVSGLTEDWPLRNFDIFDLALNRLSEAS